MPLMKQRTNRSPFSFLGIASGRRDRCAALLFRCARESKFHTRHGGIEFDSLDATERAAAELAADLGRDRLPKGEARAVTVEHRQRVLTVTISMEIDRVDPPPKHSNGEDQPLNHSNASFREDA